MTKIRLPRPEDPELAKLWDEAREIVVQRDADCCVGDRSQCRCAAKQVAMSDADVEREKWRQVWVDTDEENDR